MVGVEGLGFRLGVRGWGIWLSLGRRGAAGGKLCLHYLKPATFELMNHGTLPQKEFSTHSLYEMFSHIIFFFSLPVNMPPRRCSKKTWITQLPLALFHHISMCRQGDVCYSFSLISPNRFYRYAVCKQCVSFSFHFSFQQIFGLTLKVSSLGLLQDGIVSQCEGMGLNLRYSRWPVTACQLWRILSHDSDYVNLLPASQKNCSIQYFTCAKDLITCAISYMD